MGVQFGVGAMITMERTDRRRVYLYEWELWTSLIRCLFAAVLVRFVLGSYVRAAYSQTTQWSKARVLQWHKKS